MQNWYVNFYVLNGKKVDKCIFVGVLNKISPLWSENNESEMYRFVACSQRMDKRDKVLYYHKREQW